MRDEGAPRSLSAPTAGRSRAGAGRAGRRARAGRDRESAARHLAYYDQGDPGCGGRCHAPPLVRNGVDPLRPPSHPDEHRRVGGDRRDRRAHHPVGRDEDQVERDVDDRRGAGHDPVELRTPRAPHTDRDDDVSGERDRGKCERPHHARRRLVVGFGRDPSHDPRGESARPVATHVVTTTR